MKGNDPLFEYREYDRKDGGLAEAGAETLPDTVARACRLVPFGDHAPVVSVERDRFGISRIVVTDDHEQYYLVSERRGDSPKIEHDPEILDAIKAGSGDVRRLIARRIEANS